MNSIKYLLGATLLALLTVACGTKAPDAVVTSTKAPGAPSWVDHPMTVPGIIGVANESPNVMDDTMMQREVALVAARTIIAKQLQARVQGAFNQLNQQYDTAGSDGKKPVKVQSMARMIESVKREIVDVSLVGATPREWWTDPTTKKLWVLVVLDKDAADRAVAAAATAAVRKHIKTGEADLKDALGRLDTALAATANTTE